jgi:hypothetical protein
MMRCAVDAALEHHTPGRLVDRPAFVEEARRADDGRHGSHCQRTPQQHLGDGRPTPIRGADDKDPQRWSAGRGGIRHRRQAAAPRHPAGTQVTVRRWMMPSTGFLVCSSRGVLRSTRLAGNVVAGHDRCGHAYIGSQSRATADLGWAAASLPEMATDSVADVGCALATTSSRERNARKDSLSALE